MSEWSGMNVFMAGKNMKKRTLINGPTMFPRGAGRWGR